MVFLCLVYKVQILMASTEGDTIGKKVRGLSKLELDI